MSDTPESSEVDLLASGLSVAREKIVENRLLADLTVRMLRRGSVMDVLKGQIDAQGHDVVLEAAGIIRHVQLKATVQGGKRAHVDINVKLRAKPSGCVVWMTYDPMTLTISDYRWFGAEPGEALPDLGSKLTRHTRGSKADRPGLRNLVKGKFERLTSLDQLAEKLFGPARSTATSLVFAQLRARLGSGWQSMMSGTSQPTTFYDATEFAHLIDGYAVLEQLCEVDAASWVDRMAAQGRSGRFSNDLGLLWTQIFVEHRRWHFWSPYEPDAGELIYLDQLTRNVQAQLQRELERDAL